MCLLEYVQVHIGYQYSSIVSAALGDFNLNILYISVSSLKTILKTPFGWNIPELILHFSFLYPDPPS